MGFFEVGCDTAEVAYPLDEDWMDGGFLDSIFGEFLQGGLDLALKPNEGEFDGGIVWGWIGGGGMADPHALQA